MEDSKPVGEKGPRMQQEIHPTQIELKAPQGAKRVEEHELHPVLAEVLSESDPDTVSWVKG